jgi:DNA uptake protein ComE-like DNA-binding protein
MDLLLGEDTNRNGVLDPNEDDGEDTNPADDGDGLLTPGLLEYVTVYSSQPNTINGQAKINVTSTDPQMLQRLSSLLVNRFQQQRADELRGNLAGRSPSSVLEFYQWTRMTAEEFLKVRTDLTHSTGNNVRGLINVNTAPAEVLACIPGVGTDYAQALVAYRLAHGDQLTSMAWVTEVLPPTTVSRAGRFMTDLSYQFSADIAAVGRLGRGYSRIKVIINMTTGTPRIVYRQDLGSYGWALGSGVRDALKQSNNSNL